MNNATFTFSKRISRRTMLRNGSVALGLPVLEAMTPAFAATPVGTPAKAKRFVGVTLSLGLHNPNLVPKTSGKDYEPSKYLKPLQDIRNDFTVVSGTSHPGVKGGHTAEGSILSACPNARGATVRNTVSLDQLMAKQLGHETRFPSMVLSMGGSTSPSYTENGAMIPAQNSPSSVYAQLFVNDGPKERARQMELIRRGRSVMDVIGDEAKALKRELGRGDQEKLDMWFTSVREAERRLVANEAWINKPKPKVEMASPMNVDRNNAAAQAKAMLDIMHLALETDSTRFITLHIMGAKVSGLDGVDESYHGLSHHGRDEEKLRQLAIVEQAMIDEWANFLRKLKGSDVENRTLLDETMVLLTSNLGNASSHDNRNMPVLFGGGGFQHGRHLAFSQKNNYPLPNLYLNALHQLGLQNETFATSTGSMTGLA